MRKYSVQIRKTRTVRGRLMLKILDRKIVSSKVKKGSTRGIVITSNDTLNKVYNLFNVKNHPHIISLKKKKAVFFETYLLRYEYKNMIRNIEYKTYVFGCFSYIYG